MRTLAVAYRLSPEHPFPAARSTSERGKDHSPGRSTILPECHAVDPLIHTGYLEELAGAYVPARIDRADPRVSPLYADLKGFPPLLVQVGSAKTLLDDAVRLAAAAGAADVAVTLQVWPNMIHAWPLWNAHLDAGRRALASAGSFVREHIS